jgi:flavin reductase (DIM6/NTAB) family NADH-FMN oxidoreductase RutF
MNTNLLPINVKSLKGNLFHLLDDDWMLLTAGQPDNFNTMTASWGTFGILWNKPIAIGFIRPQRHSFEFANSSEYFTLSFFPEKFKSVLKFCGAHSGRDTDKIKETGLTVKSTEKGSIYYSEAHLVFECRKIYIDDIKPENFVDKSLIKEIYPGADFHRMFFGEIINCMASEKFMEEKGTHFSETKEGNSTDF